MFEPGKLKHLLDEPLAKARLKEVPAPFSLPSLIAWLETKDPAEEYNYIDYDNCLVAQYTKQVPGVEKPEWRTWYVAGADRFSGDTRAFVSVPLPHTFGGALERARALTSSPKGGSPSNLLAAGV